MLLNSAFMIEFENTVELFLPPITKVKSVCLKDKRYFLFFDHRNRVQCYECNTDTWMVQPVSPRKQNEVLLHIKKDYNTENNVIETQNGVCMYDNVPIGRVDLPFQVLAVHGTQCDRFQLLVWNGVSVEWWRWTGEECEAVILPPTVTHVVQGDLIWM